MMQDDGLRNESVVNDQKGFQNQKKRMKMESRLKTEKDGCPSYTAMIAEAIMRTAFKRATLAEIYDFMNSSFDQLTKRGSGWRNCVRHTLSLNDCFLKLHRPENGRSCNWTIHPSYLEAFLKGDYRKQRKNRRKVKNVPWLEKDALHYSTTLPPYLNEQDMSLRHTDHGRIAGLSQWQNYGSLQTTPQKQQNTIDTSNVNSYVMETMYRDIKMKSKTPPQSLSEPVTKPCTPPAVDTNSPNNLTSSQAIASAAFPGLPTTSFKFASSPNKEEQPNINRYGTSHMTALNPLKYNHLSYPANGGMSYHHVPDCQGYEVDLPYGNFAARSYKQEFY